MRCVARAAFLAHGRGLIDVAFPDPAVWVVGDKNRSMRATLSRNCMKTAVETGPAGAACRIANIVVGVAGGALRTAECGNLGLINTCGVTWTAVGAGGIVGFK